MFTSIHLGKHRVVVSKGVVIHNFKLTNSSKDRFFNLYKSGVYTTWGAGLVKSIFHIGE